MTAWRYEISLLVLKKYFTRSLRSLVKYFSTLEEKFRISARPYNILYVWKFPIDRVRERNKEAKELKRDVQSSTSKIAGVTGEG